MPPNRVDTTTLVILVSLALAWSFAAPLSRIAGTGGVPAIAFAFAQSAGGSLTLILVCLARRKWPGVAPPHLAYYAVAGLAGQAFPQVVIFTAVQQIPIGVMGLVISFTPLATFLFAVLARVETFSTRRGAGVLLGFAGALFVLLPQEALPDPSLVFWVAFAFLVPLCFATANVYAARFKPDGSDPQVNALGMMAVSAIGLALAMVVFGQSYWPSPAGLVAADFAVLTQAGLAGFAFVLYFTLIDRAGPVVMSMVSYLMLLLTNLWGYVFFGEVPTIWVFAAIACVLAGLMLVQVRPRSRTAPA